MKTYPDFKTLAEANTQNAATSDLSVFTTNMPSERRSVESLTKDSYGFRLQLMPKGVEIIAIDAKAPQDAKDSAVYILEGPFSSIDDANDFLNKHRIGKPWSHGPIHLE